MKNDYKYQVGEIFNVKTGSYKIIDRYIKEVKPNRHVKYYKCQCLKDNYIFEKAQHDVGRTGCPICGNYKVVLGYNTVYDVRPDLVKYFLNPEDAKKYSIYHNSKIWMICPMCGHKKQMPVCNLTTQGFACPMCSDGVSYPNKFVRAFLNQLDINFIPEKVFDWFPNRKYDQFVPEYNMIIENHGEQHYITKHGWGNDEKINDLNKKQFALENGIKHYIELDCRESNSQHIINSIMSSELPELLSFVYEDINWAECERIATGSLVYEVCEMWNKHSSYKDITKKLNISKDTIRTYIKRGYALGLTDSLRHNSTSYSGSHPIYSITDNIYFFSVRIAAEYYSDENNTYFQKRIGVAARDHIVYKNKEFRYIARKDFNKAKELSEEDPTYVVYGDYYPEKAILKEAQVVS